MKSRKILVVCILLLFFGGVHNTLAQERKASNIFIDLSPELHGEKLDAVVKTITMNAIIEQMNPQQILSMAWADELATKGLSNDDITIAAISTLLTSMRVTDYVVEEAVNDLLIPNELYSIAKEEVVLQGDMAYPPTASGPEPLPIEK